MLSTKKRDEFSTSDSICYKCFSKMESKSIEEEQRIRVGIKAHKILLIQLHDIITIVNVVMILNIVIENSIQQRG